MALMQRTAFAPAARTHAVSVVAKASTATKSRTGTTKTAAKSRPGTTKTAAPKVQRSPSGLAVLAKVEELGLLSKVQELGLLSKLEQSGLTLSKIEESGLLVQLEKSGLLKVVADKGTPGLLSGLGYALVAAAVAVVYFAPDETTGQLVAQALGAGALALGGAGALVGASFLSDLQKVE